MYEDNISSIKMIESDKYSNSTKRIDIKYQALKHLKTLFQHKMQYTIDYKS